MNVKEIKVYKCTICNHCYWSKDAADECCYDKQPTKCECGKPLEQYHTMCSGCYEKHRFEKADKIVDYTGYIYREGYGNDGYCKDLDELYDYCNDRDIPLPDYVYTCTMDNWKGISARQILERALDDYECDDGIDDKIIDENELHEFIEAWNEKQTLYSYVPNFKQVVILKEESVR